MTTAQERMETHMQKHTGRRFCAACLAFEAGASAPEGRSVMWRLRHLPGYEMRGGKCAACSRGKRVIRHVGGFCAVAAGQLVAFLLTHHRIDLCDACLAMGSDLSLMEVRGILRDLGPFEEFSRRVGVCTVCVRTLSVVAAVPLDALDETRRPDVMISTTLYHGWRIDVRSYRVLAGWRPFVLLQGASGTDMSGAPSVVSSLKPSKDEADTEARRVAEAWIEKKDLGADDSATGEPTATEVTWRNARRKGGPQTSVL